VGIAHLNTITGIIVASAQANVNALNRLDAALRSQDKLEAIA
jgi:hypothetical protein